MAKIAPIGDLERYFTGSYAVDHRPGNPCDIVRIWHIDERAITEVTSWTPRLLDHIRQSL